jgi:hypothetical protein
VNNRTIVLLIVVNGFVGFFCFRAYQQGMPLARAILFAIAAIICVTLATFLGSKLGESRARKIAERRAGRR